MQEEYVFQMRMLTDELAKFRRAVDAICAYPTIALHDLSKAKARASALEGQASKELCDDLRKFLETASAAQAIGARIMAMIDSHELKRIEKGPLQ